MFLHGSMLPHAAPVIGPRSVIKCMSMPYFDRAVMEFICHNRKKYNDVDDDALVVVDNDDDDDDDDNDDDEEEVEVEDGDDKNSKYYDGCLLS